MDYKSILDVMLNNEQYLCLSTSTSLGQPWATPLCYVAGEHRDIYFISQIDSLHALHIEANPHVAFCIFNSRQPTGNAFGVQGTGTARKVPKDEISEEVMKKLYTLISMPIIQKECSFFRIEIDEVYLPHAERWKIGNELRQKVDLE